MTRRGDLHRPDFQRALPAGTPDCPPPSADVVGEPWRAHRNLDPDADCEGTLRWVDREDDLWTVACDRCAYTGQEQRREVDPVYRRERMLEASALPPRFRDASVRTTDGNADALAHVRIMLERWHGGDRPKFTELTVRPPMLIGDPGLGKTHLLVRSAAELLERHKVACWFITMPDLLDEAKRAMDTNEPVQEILDRAARVRLLVLDDLGPGLDRDWALNTLEALVDRRYRAELPLMGSTNVPLRAWDERFGHRVASRLSEMCAPITVTGADHRRSDQEDCARSGGGRPGANATSESRDAGAA